MAGSLLLPGAFAPSPLGNHVFKDGIGVDVAGRYAPFRHLPAHRGELSPADHADIAICDLDSRARYENVLDDSGLGQLGLSMLMGAA